MSPLHTKFWRHISVIRIEGSLNEFQGLKFNSKDLERFGATSFQFAKYTSIIYTVWRLNTFWRIDLKGEAILLDLLPPSINNL